MIKYTYYKTWLFKATKHPTDVIYPSSDSGEASLPTGWMHNVDDAVKQYEWQ